MLLPVFHLPWRSIQISINIATIVFGFMTFLPLSYTSYYFNNVRCVLYGHTKFIKPGTPSGTSELYVDMKESKWGAESTCNFVTFQAVVSCIHAFIWCWYLLLMKSQLKHEKKEYTILFPCFVTHALVLVTVFVSSSMLQAGLDKWCYSLTNEIAHTYNIKLTCAETQNLQWDIMEKKHKYYNFLLVAKISSWLMTLAVLAQTLVSGYKICVWILKTETPTVHVPKKSPQRTYDSTSGYDVNNDEPTFTSEIDWDNDDSTCETSRAISFNI